MMILIQNKNHKKKIANKLKAATPTTTPTNHKGMRPVVPIFDISLTFN